MAGDDLLELHIFVRDGFDGILDGRQLDSLQLHHLSAVEQAWQFELALDRGVVCPERGKLIVCLGPLAKRAGVGEPIAVVLLVVHAEGLGHRLDLEARWIWPREW